MPYMGNVVGLIFSNMHDNAIEELIKNRTVGSILFGGRYRLIDFPLSNMVNSGISEIGIITKSNFQSLIDHVGSGREWDLARKKGGLHILPPFGNNSLGIYRGRIEALSGIMNFITRSPAEYVLMSDCDIVANIDYKPVLKAHIEKNADITVICHNGVYTMEQTRYSTVFAVNEEGRVYDVLTNPQISGMCNISLNMYLIKKELLIQLVQHSIARNQHNFERDIIQARVKELNIIAYQYEGYVGRIDSINSYYKENMALLNPSNRKQLFTGNRPIYTKVRDNAPCKYGIGSKVKNSLVADGCIIEGEVENCVIFRGVKVGKGARVKNSIIMQDTIIGEKADLNYVITDKKVIISDNRTLSGSQVYPLFVGKGATV
jgi:glucose-1-phosphate adenylyltransferase